MKFLFFLLFCFPLWGGSTFPPMDITYHPLSTNNPEVQNHFNHALTAYYAFDFQGAYLFFKKCSEIEPDLGIAYYGMALAVDKFDKEKVKELIEKAKASKSSEEERAYIDAFSAKLNDGNYVEAMQDLVSNYPDDLDAAVLFAEAILEANNWSMWEDGKAKPLADLVVSTLESVLRRNPEHVGANHYYIHTMENAKELMNALVSANYFYHLDTKFGHFVHSASHIFLPLGFYEDAVKANLKAIEIDRAYAKTHPEERNYRMSSIDHESFYLWIAYLWEDNFQGAIRVARDLRTNARKEEDLLYFYKTLIYFHKWDEILKLEEPKKNSEQAYFHFARALAFFHREDLSAGEKEVETYKNMLQNLKTKASFYQFRLAESVLKSEELYAKGNLEESIPILSDLAEKQENISLFEWFYPFRQTLGLRLIETKRFQEAEEEFRKTLFRYPRNGRVLSGLSQSLKLQNKPSFWIEREAAYALRYSDSE